MRVHLTTLTDTPRRGRAGATILTGIARSLGAVAAQPEAISGVAAC
jgi:hypothetical protein